MKIYIILIDIVLVIITYLKTNSILSAVTAVAVAVTGYILAKDSSKPIPHAVGVFSVALVASFIFFFGVAAKCIAKAIPDGILADMKNDVLNIGDSFMAGSTPPFDITGNGPSDLAIFIFLFAAVQIFIPISFALFKGTARFILNRIS